METSTSAGWAVIMLSALFCHCLAGTIYGNYIQNGNQNINSPQIEVTVNNYGGSAGKCQFKVVGRGVDDKFEDACPAVFNDYIKININNYYAYFYQNFNPLGMYSDTRGTLVIVKPNGCRLRTHKTSSEKMTESELSTEVCDKIKEKLTNEMKALDDYWEKWEVNFERGMDDLPPVYDIVDPLENQPPLASLYAGQPGVAESTFSGGLNTASTPIQRPQLLTPSKPPQPLTSSIPAQPMTPTTQAGGPTILGVDSIRSNDDSVNSQSITSNLNEYKNGNQCMLEKTLRGNGVHDCFKIPCPENTPTGMSFKGLVVWGNPDLDPFSLFSDERATLYLFERGWCTKKTYTTSNRVTTSRAQVLSAADCAQAKKRFGNALKKQGISINPDKSFTIDMSYDSSDEKSSSPTTLINAGVPLSQPTTSTLHSQQAKPLPSVAAGALPHTSTPPLNADIKSKIIKVTTSIPKTSNGKCQMVIAVIGKGVEDKFTEPCSDKPADSLSTDKVFIFGDPKKNTFSLYSNEPNILYVIKNKICTKKTYTTNNGVTKSIRTPMKLNDCNKIKNTITDLLASQQSKPFPSGAAPSFSQSLQPVATPAVSGTSLVSPVSQTLFNPFPSGFPFMNVGIFNPFVNQSPSLVSPVSGVADYNPGPSVTSSSNPSVTWRNGNFNRIYNGNLAVNINKNNNGPSGCTMTITLIGRGVNDEVKGTCSEMGTNIKKKTTSFSLAVADPSTSSGIYTEDWSSLVVIKNGECTKREYESSPIYDNTKITSSPLGKVQCDKAKRKISGMLGANFG